MTDYIDRSYKATRLSREEEAAMVDCPNCDATHPASYRLIACGHPHCETLGCHECFFVCQVSSQCGYFCGEHVNDTNLGGALRKPIKSCLRCEKEDLNDTEGAFVDCESRLEVLRLMPEGAQTPELLRFLDLLQYPFSVQTRTAKAGGAC